MAQSTYADALARLLAHEGGYTNDTVDPGGPTNFGITITDYHNYVKPNATAADVRAMKLDEAKAIYRSKYWDAQRCDELPAGVDYAVFDYGVNSGIGRSGKVLRRCLKLADTTGAVNDAVIAAAAAADAKVLIVTICDERLRFLQSLKTWGTFGKGWGARVAEVRVLALQLAAEQQPPFVPAQAGTQSDADNGPGSPLARGRTAGEVAGKGVVPVAKGAQQGSAGAIIIAGAAAASQAHQAEHSVLAVVCIAVITIGMAAGARLFWESRQKKQQDKPA
jgi:lysozyme family protein